MKLNATISGQSFCRANNIGLTKKEVALDVKLLLDYSPIIYKWGAITHAVTLLTVLVTIILEYTCFLSHAHGSHI